MPIMEYKALVLLIVCLAIVASFGKYINDTDIDLSKFNEYLQVHIPENTEHQTYNKSVVRDALFNSILDSLDVYTKKHGTYVFGQHKDRLNYSYKTSKDYVLNLQKDNFTEEGKL